MSGKYFLQSGLRVLELLVKMDILYEDKDKIILNKPAGQLSQSGKSFEMDLVSEVLTYRKSKGEEADISRLDIHLITGRHHQIRVQLASRNMPVAGDGKYGGNMAVQAAERIKGIRIKRGCIALCAVILKVDGKLYEVKPGFYFCIYVSNELISALAREFGHCVMIYFYLSLSFISISLVSVDS